jgi:chromate reductase, NAD(P)H dehydrogenase (quinone)
MSKIKITAICGSTKQASVNKNLLNAIASLMEDKFELQIFNSIDKIPHFNPDLDHETPPEQVADFRNQLAATEAVLICTPEYAMGVPGTLKNAIDWLVSSSGFSHKPVALITASSQGYRGHASLLETLKMIEAVVSEETQLVIPFARTKVSNDNRIIDAETQENVVKVMNALEELVRSEIERTA